MNEATFVIIIKLTKSKCEEPCEGRLSSTVPREGWVKIPPLTRQNEQHMRLVEEREDETSKKAYWEIKSFTGTAKQEDPGLDIESGKGKVK